MVNAGAAGSFVANRWRRSAATAGVSGCSWPTRRFAADAAAVTVGGSADRSNDPTVKLRICPARNPVAKAKA